MKKYIPFLLLTAVISSGNFVKHTYAQEVVQEAQPPAVVLERPQIADDVIPVMSANDSTVAVDTNIITHPPLRLTPDKSEIIRIPRAVGSVIIGNPTHLNILVDSTNMLVAVPRAPGASFFTVLDERGDIIMQRHVIVAAPTEKYVRIRRTCGENECQETSVYYCPDMCHEILIPEESDGESASAEELAESGSNISAPSDAQSVSNEGIANQ